MAQSVKNLPVTHAGDLGSIPGLECKSWIRLSNETTKTSGVWWSWEVFENSCQEQGEPASDLGQGLPFGLVWPHL